MTSEWPWRPDSQICPLYTKPYPPGLNFSPFRSTTRRNTRLSKSECTVWPQNDLEHSKIPYIQAHKPSVWSVVSHDQPFARYKVLTSDAQIFILFDLRPVVFEIQDCWKSKKLKVHGMKSVGPWTLNNQNYSLYKQIFCPWGPNVGPFHSTISRLHISCTFYNSPLIPMLNTPPPPHPPPPKKAKNKNSQMWLFFKQLW